MPVRTRLNYDHLQLSTEEESDDLGPVRLEREHKKTAQDLAGDLRTLTTALRGICRGVS